MKNILVVSACLKRCSIAIFYEGTLYEINENADAASNLVWLADNLIQSNNIDLNAIDGIITASGPGSFTGIRVAQSFAKGLALSLKLPAASVNYFDVVENIVSRNIFKKDNRSFKEKENKNLVIVIRSEKNQVYYQYQSKTGISTYDELLSSKISEESVVLVGDAANDVVVPENKKIVDKIYIPDFRNAKYLLDFSDLINQESSIRPWYIPHTENIICKVEYSSMDAVNSIDN